MPVRTIMSTTARALGHLGVEGRVLGATHGAGRAFVLVDVGLGRHVFVDASWHADDPDAALVSLSAELRRRMRLMPVVSVTPPRPD